MIKALLLIFDTVPTWERVVAARRRMMFVLFIYLLPTVVLACAAEGAGLAHWGKWQPLLHRNRPFSQSETILYEAVQLGLTLAVVFVCAQVVKVFGETFHNRQTYAQSFTLVAYALGPLFLLRLFDAFPDMSPWITWGVGIVLAIWVLYQGLPRVLLPDPSHAFGLYLMSALMLFLVTGLERLFTAMYLQGRIDMAHSYLGIKLSHLFGIQF